MPRYKLTIEYDGTDYSGWQIQPNAVTIEETLEQAFSTVLQQPIDLAGQGRTDAGVHALGQVAHVDLPETANAQDVISAVNKMSGEAIQIVDYKQVQDDFHARFDATARQYRYELTLRNMPLQNRFVWALRQPVEQELLHQCAALILGEHDFAGFSKFNADNRTTLCDIQESAFEESGEVLRYHIRANRFLRNMVRRLVGTMVYVAQGKISVKEFQQKLEKPAFKMPTYTAPAKGLVLEKIFYKKVKKTLESS